MSIKNQYRNHHWFQFRDRIIKLDGEACVLCGRTRESGAILQVHHTQYIPRKALWDYPDELCETLCKRCHAEQHGKIRPEHGWECVGMEDLGDLSGRCDRCETEVRYLFFIQHPEWEAMEVGTNCCDELTETKIASERIIYLNKLERFINSTRWNKRNEVYMIRQKRFLIQIKEVKTGYCISINNAQGKKSYPSLTQAKERVFDFISSGDADRWWAKKMKQP